jgi:hypothetical protein
MQANTFGVELRGKRATLCETLIAGKDDPVGLRLTASDHDVSGFESKPLPERYG